MEFCGSAHTFCTCCMIHRSAGPVRPSKDEHHFSIPEPNHSALKPKEPKALCRAVAKQETQFSRKAGDRAQRPWANVCVRDKINLRQGEVARDATWTSDTRSSTPDAKRTFLSPRTYLLDLPSHPPERFYFRSAKREHEFRILERNHCALKQSEPPQRAVAKHETCASRNCGVRALQLQANVAIPGTSSSDRVMWR